MVSLQLEHVSLVMTVVDSFGAVLLLFIAVTITPESGYHTKAARLQLLQRSVIMLMSITMMWYGLDLLGSPRTLSVPNLLIHILLLTAASISAVRTVLLKGELTTLHPTGPEFILSHVNHCLLVDGLPCVLLAGREKVRGEKV